MLNKFIIPVVALVALATGLLFQYQNAHSSVALPAFELADTQGVMHKSDEWQGKVLVINFWASWCPPCLQEIPEFVALQNSYASQGLQFVGIAIDEAATAEAFAKKLQINYPSLVSSPQEGIALSKTLGNGLNTLPYSVVVNRKGDIVYRHMGVFDHDQIVETITPLLAESVPL